MQAKTEQNLTNFNVRVQRLHAATGQTWADLADSLQVSRTMLHYYRTGQHPPDAQVLFRLREAERQAGSAGDYPPTGDHPLEGDIASAGLETHLRWLRGALLRQQEVVASAQRHLNEIEHWVRDAETELAARGDRGGGGGSGSATDGGPVPGFRTSEPAPVVPVGKAFLTDDEASSGSDDGGDGLHRASRAKERRARLRDIDTVSLPIFGYLPAGWPQSSEGVRQQHAPRRVTVRKGRFPEGAFGLEVRGDSMNAATPEPIFHGDTVVLVSPEQREPKSGDIVAALIDGETCLKRLANGHRPAHLRSESDNPAYRAIYPLHELVIQGVMVGKL